MSGLEPEGVPTGGDSLTGENTPTGNDGTFGVDAPSGDAGTSTGSTNAGSSDDGDRDPSQTAEADASTVDPAQSEETKEGMQH